MKSVTIEGQLRTESGKKATRQLRSQQLVPGVIYGGKSEINFSAPASAFKGIVYTSEFMLADVNVDGTAYRCILKDIQFNKVTDALLPKFFSVITRIALSFLRVQRAPDLSSGQ